MVDAPLPENESERVAALQKYGLLDSGAEPAFDAVTDLAARLCDAPIALISLVDRRRLWFKSAHGLEGLGEMPRRLAFCAHAILGTDPFEVFDARADARFAGNLLVTGEPFFRSYFGVALCTPEGHALGTLCVIDRVPRRLTEAQRASVARLACVVSKLIEGRRADLERAQGLEALVHSESRLRQAMEAAGYGMWDWRVTSSLHAYFSPLWSTLLGFAPGDLGNHVTAWDSRIAPEDRALAHATMSEHLAGRSEQYQAELRTIARDGSTVWVLDQARVVERDAGGRPTRVIGTRADISARKRLEQDLIEARESLEARVRERTRDLGRRLEEREQELALLNRVFDDAPIGLGLLDADLRYQRINRCLAEFHERPPCDCLHLRIGDLAPALENSLAPVLRRVLESGAAETGVELGCAARTGGGIDHWLASAHRVALAGQTWGVSLILIDLTTQRLFKPFGRLHGAERSGGSGFGLAAVRSIVERHGGQVWADARPGEGATFCFTLPAESGPGKPSQ